MQPGEPIRIISDLHLGHPSSKVETPSQLAPLLEGCATLIFNGDSVETHFEKRKQQGLRDAETLRALCTSRGVTPIFLNGNHDPDLSELNHVDLAGGSVLVTHGDILFYSISPWSWKKAGVMRKAHSAVLAEMDEESLNDFEKRLHASKQAALALELHDMPYSRGPLASIAFLLEEIWPPWKPFQILKCWQETPGRAVALLQRYRPHAKFIIIGHTHRAGIWRIGPRVVINTGSFVSLAKHYAVDIAGTVISVKSIVMQEGSFVTSREIARFEAGRI